MAAACVEGIRAVLLWHAVPEPYKDPECTLIADLSHFSRLSPRSTWKTGGEKSHWPPLLRRATQNIPPPDNVLPPEAIAKSPLAFTARCGLLQTFERNGEWVAMVAAFPRYHHHGWHHSRFQVGPSKASVIRRLRKGRLRRRLHCFLWSRRGVLPPVASICATGKAARAMPAQRVATNACE